MTGKPEYENTLKDVVTIETVRQIALTASGASWQSTTFFAASPESGTGEIIHSNPPLAKIDLSA